MLPSRPRGKFKVKESIYTKPTDQRFEFPSEKPRDTMNFPHKFTAFTAIAFWIVLFLLCGHSRAAPAVRYKMCTSDYECNHGEFCRQKPVASYCTLCLDCNRYNREPNRRCAKVRNDCGPCQPGFGELGPHCSRLVKEIVMSYATDQSSKHDQGQGPKSEQPASFSRWLVVPAVLVIVMATGVVVIGHNVAGGAVVLDETKNNEEELDELSMDLEPFAGNDHDDDAIAIGENHNENWDAMDLDHNNVHQVTVGSNNDPEVNEDNNNGPHNNVEHQVANALQNSCQDPQQSGLSFGMHGEMSGFHVPPSPNPPEDNTMGAHAYGDQVVPDMAQINNLCLPAQILGGDLVQIFDIDDEMDNFSTCG